MGGRVGIYLSFAQQSGFHSLFNLGPPLWRLYINPLADLIKVILKQPRAFVKPAWHSENKTKTAEAHSAFFLPLLQQNPILATYRNKVQRSTQCTLLCTTRCLWGLHSTLTAYHLLPVTRDAYSQSPNPLGHITSFPVSARFFPICWNFLILIVSGRSADLDRTTDTSRLLFRVFVKTFPDKRAAAEIICCPYK